MNEYNKTFYSGQMAGSMLSAEHIIPQVIDMLSPIQVKSVVDFGCGVGGWLSYFLRLNPSGSVFGLDTGKPDKKQLQISEKDYKRVDLSKAVNLNRKFDLCMSLEVAEHIPSECAENFVDNLCRHADIILFSAAIPGQGGIGHINEQLLSYWVEKFRKRSYILYDIVRPCIWEDRDIEVHYKQNVVLFIKDSVELENCSFRKKSQKALVDIAHPDFVYVSEKMQNDRLINRSYLYIHHKKLFFALRKIKHIFISK